VEFKGNIQESMNRGLSFDKVEYSLDLGGQQRNGVC
jgi:hypothetical protein